MVHSEFRVIHRGLNLHFAAQCSSRAIRTAVDDMAHQVENVDVRATHPILKGDEVSPDILGGAWNETQHLWQAPQHLHLRCATCSLFFLPAAAQLLQKCHGPTGWLFHVEIAQAGELDHLAGRRHTDHGVTVLAPCAQILKNRQEVVLEKQHAGNNDIGPSDIGLAARDQIVVSSVLRCGVKAQGQARKVFGQVLSRALDRTRQVGIHGHDHDMNRSARLSLKF